MSDPDDYYEDPEPREPTWQEQAADGAGVPLQGEI